MSIPVYPNRPSGPCIGPTLIKVLGATEQDHNDLSIIYVSPTVAFEGSNDVLFKAPNIRIFNISKSLK